MQDIPYGYCHCGCGEKTRLSPQTVRKLGYVKGKPRPYIFNHHKRGIGPKYEVRDLGYKTPCWLFLGYVSKKGYASMRPHGSKTMRAAHRWYYEQANGPVPEGLTLDHLCHTHDINCPGGACIHRRCVNPDHLEPCERVENAKRGRKAGPKLGSTRPKKTHCKHGHEFTPENTVKGSDGARRCRTCRNAGLLRYYYRNRGAKP